MGHGHTAAISGGGNVASANRRTRSSLPWLAIVLLCVVAASAMFLLPFAFPPGGAPLRSTSYAVGFNNRVALLAFWASVGVGVLIALWQGVEKSPQVLERTRVAVNWRLQVVMSLVYLGATLAIYGIAQSAESYGLDWESSHFMWRMKLTSAYGMQPYLDYQFEYGPLLAYLPIFVHTILHTFGATTEISYYITHAVLNIAGLLSIAYVLSCFAMEGHRREITFVVVGLSAFLPNMGLNGVVLRYTAPFALLLLLHRRARSISPYGVVKVFLVAAASAGLCLSLSAEIGIVFVAVLFVYAALSLPNGKIVAPVAAGLIASLALAQLVLPAQYSASLAHFSKGGNNLPLLISSPHLVFFLATALLVIPKWLAGGFALEGQSRAVVLSVGVLPLMLAPGALGRCDPYHVLFYGLGTTILAFLLMASRSTTTFSLYAAAYTLIFVVGLEMINFWVFRISPGMVGTWLTETWRGNRSAAGPTTELTALLKYDKLALVFGSYGYTKPVQTFLWTNRKVAPEYFMGAMGIYTQSQMAERLNDLARFNYVLIDESYRHLHEQHWHQSCVGDGYYLRKALLWPGSLPCVQTVLNPDAELSRFLARSYEPVERVGRYMVLREKP